jgi:hypothetical protein
MDPAVSSQTRRTGETESDGPTPILADLFQQPLTLGQGRRSYDLKVRAPLLY